MKTSRRQGIAEVAMISPAMTVLVVFLIMPFVVSIALSFTNQRLVQGPVPTAIIGMRNFFQILSDTVFWRTLLNVLYFTVLVIPLQCGTALLLAVLLNKQKILKGALRSVFYLPFITPMVIVSVVWKTLYQYPNGVFNYLLGVISGGAIQPVDWLGTASLAMPAIVVLSAWQAYGFQMVIYLGGLQSIPNELYEAADIDGASKMQQFAYVTWPSLADTNVLILVITTIQALKLFTQVNLLTQGGPAGSTNTLVHYIYDAGFRGQKIGYSSAASILVFLVVLFIVMLQRMVLARLGSEGGLRRKRGRSVHVLEHSATNPKMVAPNLTGKGR